MQRSLLSLGILGTLLGGAPASAQLSSPVPTGAPPVTLDVPYLPQSELLCGGAALAMVERYWGRRGVYAEDYASLVREEEGGIRTGELARAARAQEWETAAFDGTPEQVRYLLSKRIPVIALIEVGPRRYHYVVLLDWSRGKVRYHDPARAPNRQVDEEQFQEEWAGGARWAMTIRPPAISPAPAPRPDTAAMAPMPCAPWVDQGLDAAARGQLDSAVVLLTTAQRACPQEPVVLRELAGVRFRQRRYDQSSILSEAYVAQVPDDSLGWNILATSEYLTGDPRAAMRAWRQIGGLEVDLVRIDGLRRTRYRVAEEAVGIRHSTQLDARMLAMARRRVNELPAFYRGRVAYLPVAGGRTEVRAVVAERPLIEPMIPLVAGNGLSAAAREEVALELGSLMGAGERWNASWRWDHAHPRTSVELAVPFRLGLAGVVTVSGAWERFRYGIDSTTVAETRRTGGLGFGAWVIPAFRPALGLRYDRWSHDRRYIVLSQGNAVRLANDRLTLRTTVETGIAGQAASSYLAGSIRARWASSSLLQRTAWSIRYGWDLVDSHTPAGLWPFASGDVPWAIPLRAHPFTLRDLLPAATIARTIMHGGVAVDQPVYQSPLITLALGGFVDWALLRNRLDRRPARTLVDGGGGLRIGFAGGALGIIRIDVATGLNDDHSAVTVGLHREWPL